ncbi:LysR family transcriptional regulator [Aliikangiella coralliicola]|uniref:LysR family transcriptional regulator n=1 Tax=Aliikangiella coralliicola TaxID=2592383 RepID=A0A545U7F0_9GAMM|nr:LysR family transcriptional regulator [Aliikangiella coralliicola]TQV85397.1 LysR family transcriptional regulator [Aliikangiella coralliicola]
MVKDLNWNDLKVVYRVASFGSLGKAAEQLNINYTTVLRHINRLEKALGCKMFIRHQRGYQLTDSGKQLLVEMPDIEVKLDQLQSKLTTKNNNVTGTLKITTLPEYSSFLHPILKRSQQLYPELRILADVSDEIVPLESGRAHISIRAGHAPTQGDLVANKICDLNFSYYASSCYISRRGIPENEGEFNLHTWVMPSGRKRHISFIKNIIPKIDSRNIHYQSNNFFDIQSAIEHGIGIGPVDDRKAKNVECLTKITQIKNFNDSALWFVYHRDLREDVKIKTMLKLLNS